MRFISIETIRNLRRIVFNCQQLGRYTEIQDFMKDISEGHKVNDILVHRNSLQKLLKPGGAGEPLTRSNTWRGEWGWSGTRGGG